MENKNNLGSVYTGGVPATPVVAPPVNRKPDRKRWYMIILIVTGALLAAGAVWFLVFTNNRSNNGTQFNNSQIDLTDVAANDIKDTGRLSIVGQLSVEGGFAITPSTRPTNPLDGQLYFDQTTNTLSYYNGSSFVELKDQQLTAGDGLANQNGVLSNSGVLSLQGATGNVTLTAGDGITITGTTISATGGSGTINGTGTAGKIIKFTGVDTIADSLLTESGTTISVAGDLSVSGGLSLTTALSVSSGGTGASSLTTNGVLVGNGTGAVSSVTAAGAGLCLQSTAGAPAFAACPGGGGSVTSLNGLSGALTLANASGAGSTITIDDATTAAKGIASFNSTNFTVTSGAVNTIQSIATSASPTFAGLTLSSVGAADSATYLCRNTSNQLAACNTSGAGVAFVNGGNSFSGTATLGTNDNNDLVIERNNIAQLTIDAGGVVLASGRDLLLSGAASYISNPQDNFGNSEAFGLNASVSGANNATAVGNGASSLGSRSVAFGQGTSANNDDTVILGAGANSTNNGAIAIGFQATAGFGGLAIGYQASAAHNNAIAIHGTTTAGNQLVVGSSGAAISDIYFGSGVSGATPSAFTLHGSGGSGTDIAGADVNVAGGQSTGNAFGGSINFLVSPAGALSGGSSNGLSTVASIGGATGAALFQNATNTTQAFRITPSAGGNLFVADTVNSRVGIALGGSNTPNLAVEGLEVKGAIRISGTSAIMDNYSTPGAANIGARFSVVNVDMSASQQVIAVGVTALSNANSRGITVLDARAGAHQPSISVISPDENEIAGFSWDGSNTSFLVKNSSGTGTISLQVGGTNRVTATTSGATVSGTLSSSSTLGLGAYGTTDSAAYLCLNSSNIIAQCNSTGTGVAFINGGNSFGGTATLGTDDANGVDIKTSGTVRLSLASGGGISIARNDTADELEVGDNIFDINDSSTRINLGNTAGDTYLRIGEGSLTFGFLGWLNSSNLLRLGTFGAQDVRLETNSAARFTISGTGDITVGSSDTTGSLLVLDTKTGAGDPTGVNGAMYYNSNLGKFRCYQNSVWEDCIGNNTGEIKAFAGSAAPSGWLLCDGSAVSRTTYAGLFAVISTTYGAGDGSTTFNLPNCKGRQIVGRDSGQTEFDVLGETGGEKTHTLTTGELPAHSHTFSGTTSTDGAHTHNVGRDFDGAGGSSRYTVHDTGTSGAGGLSPTSSAGSHSHTYSGTTSSVGSGTAHNVMDPYLVLNYIIKT